MEIARPPVMGASLRFPLLISSMQMYGPLKGLASFLLNPARCDV